MARKKKQDKTSDNIQNIVNDASVSEKKTSQKRARSKVEDASSNKEPEIAELEDRLGLSIDYNDEENVITLTPNRPQQSVSSLRRRPLDADEFVADGDEVPDYVFGAAAQQLPLINRCELYLIGRAFTPTIVEKLWEPTDDDPLHTYRDMEDCSIETFNSDPWNLFIYSKAGRQAVTFGELTSGTFYLQCAAAEYAPNQNDPTAPIKQPMKDVYDRQMYRKVYFNGQVGQFPRITIGSYQGEDSQTGERTTTQYDKYQYVANEELFASNHMVWPQRKVTIYLEGLNFTVNASTLYEDERVNKTVKINNNHSRNGQIIEITLPEQYSKTAPYTPTLNMPLKLEVEKNPVDLLNAYRYAHDANVEDWQYDQKCWGGELHLRIEPEDCGPEDGKFSDTSLYICAKRASSGGNNPSDSQFETIYVSDYNGPKNDPQHKFIISGIDRNVDVYITSVRKNYTKKFIIMTDGNVIISDQTQLNDYLRLYTDEQIKQMNEPDRIVVGYQNTIGFLSTSPEWPWNKTIRVSAAIASEYRGIRFKAIGRYNDSSHMYDEYVKYRQGIGSVFTWDDSAQTIDGITCTPSHNGESEYSEEQPYIDYSISIERDALDASWERQIFYLAFEPIPKFVSTTLKIFIGYDPAQLQVKTKSGTELNEQSDSFVVRNGDLWSFKYTTKEDDLGIDSRDPGQEGFLFEITNNGISTSQYSHVFISDNTTTIRDRIGLPASGSTYLSFTGRMYHNMSLFIRPLVAAKIKFFSNHDLEFGPNNQHFYIEYNGDTNVPLGSDRQLTSEDDLTFSVKHLNDENPAYNYISVDVEYGSNRWVNLGGGTDGTTHKIPNANTVTFSIAGFAALLDPNIKYCYVTIKLAQLYLFSINIKHPDNSTPYWSGDASAVLRNNSLNIGGQDVSFENIETTTVDNITTTKYTFSSIYGVTGTGSIDINSGHSCGRAVYPDGSYMLTTNLYERRRVSIPITVNADDEYVLDIQPFKEMKYQFKYQSDGGGGHITVVPYTFKYYNRWPENMDDISDMTVHTSWQPTSGNDMTSLVTPDLRIPLFGFRLLPTFDPVTRYLDIFSKMTLKLQVVNSGGSVVDGPWDIASDYDFENWNSYFGVCPGSLPYSDARAYFYSKHNGEDIIYQFLVKMDSRIAAEDLRITKVVYAKNTGGTGTVDEDSSNPGINEIGNDARLPGENPSNISGNLEVYVHVPHELDTDHTLSLEFLDSSDRQLDAMYPRGNAATLVSSNIYKFSVTTRQNELYGVQSPNHTLYSGDNQYTMKVNYNDIGNHWLAVETCKYYIHPVFKLLFTDGTTTKNSFSFDDSGNATIYFSVHIAGAPDASHPSGTTRTPNSGVYLGDPDMKIPTGSTYNQTQWNDSGCVLKITNAPGLSFKCDGVEYEILGGHFYKLEVSGGVGFSGEVTLTMNVFNKTKTANISNYVSVLGSYWVRGVEYSGGEWTSDLASCDTSMTGLVLNPLITTKGGHSNIEIYMNVQSELTIDYICEDSNVDQYLEGYWQIEVINDGSYGDTTPDGQPYTHVAVIKLRNPLIQAFLDKGSNNEVYSGKKFNTRLFAKQGETEVWSETIQITIGRFGDAMHDNVPVIMSGAPGEYPSYPRIYKFNAYGRFIQKSGDGVEPVIYSINNSGTDVHGEVTFSDSSVGSIVSVSYDSDKNEYTVSIPVWDIIAADQPQEWAGGLITSKITLQEPWYIADGPFERVIRFEKYLNFYREYREDSEDQDYYVLADLPGPGSNRYFYCQSEMITNESNYMHQFDGPLHVPTLGENVYVYYMTFRVTTIVDGDKTYAQIKRITYTDWDGKTTAIFWGQASPSESPLKPIDKIKSDFSQSDIENANCAWYGQCTLVKNKGSVKEFNSYKHEPLVLSSGETGRPTYGWNLGQGYSVDSVLSSSSLDDYPIWSNRWEP